jgi:plastocyanin
LKRLFAIALVAGCGGDGGNDIDATTSDGPPRDAAVDALPDAITAVVRVTCPSAPNATIMTSNFAFVPSSLQVRVNDVVKLMPEPIHRIIPHASLPSDPGLRSGASGEVRCVQFTMTGNFNYQCAPHPMMVGVVMVSN